MIRIMKLQLPPNHTEAQLKKKIVSMLGIRPEELLYWRIVKRSIDARKKPEVTYVYQIDVHTERDSKLVKRKNNPNLVLKEKERLEPLVSGTERLAHRPIVIGFGPAGMFCGYLLAKYGYTPLILERGSSVEERQADVNRFWETGVLNPESNVQFGEGGAGTFSDGKLNTLVKDPSGRNRKVLELFVEMGADPSILYDSKPHIGTDKLCEVVVNLRKEILKLGGEIRFNTKVTDFVIEQGKITAVKLADDELIESDTVVLAIGHSARDTFETLANSPVKMTQKPFAVGVRIQHPQEMIDHSQYGENCPYHLPAASYKLAGKASDGRGVYSFCMCPGGYVVNASSENGMMAVNGMSYRDRAGINANSAIIVTVGCEDFGSDDVLAGMEYQRRLERAAFLAGKGLIPIQLFGDFENDRVSTEFGDVLPAIKGGYTFANLKDVLTKPVSDALVEGIHSFERQITGFSRADAILAGIESRTSSPVRIERGKGLESNVAGLYPCGEGAGYAGGITSAAMDGLKVAEEIIRRYAPIG
ncbi:MAG: FAD-dependent oxidoreductase [Lachnospiraceae bacterium]|nr:FAD-dependent oxidoreductase [Lachnospiraceae bacterium]